MWKRGKLAFCLIVIQVTFMIIFALIVDYHGHANVAGENRSLPPFGSLASFNRYFPMFQNVHIMVVIGFGFVMTFLKRYSYTAVGLNLLICGLSFQWSLLVQNAWDAHDGKIYIHIISIVQADVAAIAVIISSGVLLGRANPLQLIVMTLIEIVLFSCNQRLALNVYKISDIGNSMLVHTFGAYYGLGVSFILNRCRDYDDETDSPSTIQSNMFAMVGTLFLWTFWPSYNSAMADEYDHHRAVINTYLSLVTCTVTSFGLSSLFRHDNKFSFIHIQNATIAGGVAIGTAANMLVYPHGAMIIGFSAACVSVLGYQLLSPFLLKRWKIEDRTGVHNVHGLPGIVGGIVGSIMAFIASKKEYGDSIFHIFPAVAPEENTNEFYEITSFIDIKPGDNRTFSNQALFQIAALITTLAVSIVGGLLSGLVLRFKIWDPSKSHKIYEDGDLLEMGNIAHEEIN